MTLRQKREIVRRFFDGESIQVLTRRVAYSRCDGVDDYLNRLAVEDIDREIEQVIRDHNHGKFQLEPKRKKK